MSSQQCSNFAAENKKEVFDIRNDRYKFESVLRAKAMPSLKKVDSHDVSLSLGILG